MTLRTDVDWTADARAIVRTFFYWGEGKFGLNGRSPRPLGPREGVGLLGRGSHPSPPAWESGECCKLVQQGPGRSPGKFSQILPKQEIWKTTEAAASVASMDAMALDAVSPKQLSKWLTELVAVTEAQRPLGSWDLINKRVLFSSDKKKAKRHIDLHCVQEKSNPLDNVR